ncbi:MAG: acyl-CoA dehydrogenase, partial [Leptospiraceae bacterium]|nr:acyl-CoA dehydrogenase [Leptospiraceae bacterium]
MNLFETLNSIEDKIPKEDIFKEVLSKLAEENYFTVLKDNDYFTFHQKIIKLSSHPHGPGIGLSVMAQINIAG